MTFIPHREAVRRSGLVPMPLVPSAYGVAHHGESVTQAEGHNADPSDGPSLSVPSPAVPGTPLPATPSNASAFGTYRPAEPVWSVEPGRPPHFDVGVRRDEPALSAFPGHDPANDAVPAHTLPAAISSVEQPATAPAGIADVQSAHQSAHQSGATDQPLVRAAPVRPDGLGARIQTARSTYASLSWPKKVIYGVAGVIVGYLALILLLLVMYRFINPPVSSLMVQRWLGGTSIEYDWVPIERMSPNVIRAVISSEDARFCQHFGVDIQELQNAIERGGDGPPRGGSTISMQVVKNLFLWPAKSYVRKAIELPMTYVMEFLWPKSRVLEVYLNIAEWGPGVFGVEAAARHHFGKSAAALSEREAARLAVSLPNPFVRVAGKPGPGTRRLGTIIQRRMRQLGGEWLTCVLPEASR